MSIPPSNFMGKFRISSNRLQEWDYGSPGYYFITICTKDHIPWFGEIEQDKIILSPAGEIAAQNIGKIQQTYKFIDLDAGVVMPNHVHAIIAIVETFQRNVSTKTRYLRSGTLGSIISQYKSACTKHIHLMGSDGFAWQTRYYDHIIRNEISLENIRAYILGNPTKRTDDEYFPNL